MTIRRTSTLHDLIRGGDAWRHQQRMLLASLRFSLMVGLVIALAVAGSVFYYGTEPKFRAAIVSHYEARFHAWAQHDAYPIRHLATAFSRRVSRHGFSNPSIEIGILAARKR